MNWDFQRKQVKPTAKSCNWCENFSNDLECVCINGLKDYGLTHRLLLKVKKENWEFRYCKLYKYSAIKFKAWKKFCEEKLN